MDTDKTEKTPKATTNATNPTSTTGRTESKKKTKPKKTTPNQTQNLPKEKTPQPQQQRTQKQTTPDASNTSNANLSSQEQNPAKQTENQQDQTTATKRKLQTNSPQVHQKKTKHTAAANKDPTDKEHTVVINGKACVQRNLDFWDEKTDKFIHTLNLWKIRDLSLKGKKTSINILAAACLWYPAYVYHLPDWKKFEKVKRSCVDFSLGKQKGPGQTSGR